MSKSALLPPGGTRPAKVRLLGKLAPSLIIYAVLGVLIIAPLAIILVASVTTRSPSQGLFNVGEFTLDNFVSVLSASGLVGDTLLVAGLSTLLAMVIGCLFAWYSARTDVPLRGVIYVAGIAPLFLSSLVGAIAWSQLGSPRAGVLNILLRGLGLDVTINVYSMAGIIFVMAMYYTPYAFLLVRSALLLIHPSLEEAAEIHGGTTGRVLRSITFPLVIPAILGSGLLTFALVASNFPVPEILGSGEGIQVLPSTIYHWMTSSPAKVNQASAAGVLLMIVMAAVVLLQAGISRAFRVATMAGKGFNARKVHVTGVARWFGPALAIGYLLLAVVLPVLALLRLSFGTSSYIGSAIDIFAGPFGLDRINAVFSYTDALPAIQNTLVVSGLTAVLGTAFLFALAFFTERTRAFGRGFVRVIAMSPVAVPSVVLGIGLLWWWINLPIPVYGTLVVFVFAFTAHFMPQGYQSIATSIGQIDPELEEAALMSGASRFRAVRFVTLPLMQVAVRSTALLLAVLSLREISTSIFLYTTDTRLLAIMVYEQWSQGTAAAVAILGLIEVLLPLPILVFVWRFLVGGPVGEVRDTSRRSGR